MSEENKYPLTDPRILDDLKLGDAAMYETDVTEEDDELADMLGDSEIGQMMRYVSDAAGGNTNAIDPAPGAGAVPVGQGSVQTFIGEDDGQAKTNTQTGVRSVPYIGPAIDFGIGTMRATGDVAVQSLAGVDDAVRNTMNLIPFVEDLTQWLDNTFGDGDYDPGLNPPKTIAGGFAREATKFLTGFIPVSRGIKAVSWAAKAGRVTKETVAGAITEFAVRAPDDARLADMLLSIGLPNNLITSYLKTDKADSKLEARFKNAIEGAIGSQLAEGIFKAVKYVKQLRKVKKDNPEVLAHADVSIKSDEIEGKAMVEALKRLGDPEAAIVQTIARGAKVAATKKAAGTRATKDLTAEKISKDAKGIDLGKDGTVFVNYARIAKAEDVKQAIHMITENTKPLIGKTKRFSLSQKQQKEYAERLGMTERDLLNRPDGSVWTAEQVIAAKSLWENAAENLVVAAGKAAAPTASKIDTYLYRRMQSTFAAINAEIRGASAESSRALRAWGIEAPELANKARLMNRLLDEHGGIETSKQMAERVLALAKNGLLTSKAGVRFLDKSAGAKGLDAVREAWVAGLLWLPSTHVVNGTSAIMVLMHQLANRKVASMMSDSVHADEAAFAVHGMVSAMKDAFRYAGKAYKSGDSGYWAAKAETGRVPAFTAEAFGLQSESTLGQLVNGVGTFARTPLRVLGATDEFSKTIAYRGELHMLALRDATAKGLKGDEMAKAIANTLENPPARMKIQSMDAALYATFQDKGGAFSSFLAKVRNDPNTNVVGRFALTMVLPFVKTPARILNYSIEHTPIALMQRKFWQDINGADPAKAAIAKAKIATGTSMMAISLDLADSGVMTGNGPRDKAEREVWLQDHQPYSLKVGDKWYSFNRMDPMGMLFGFSADVADITHRYELGDTDMDELSELVAGGVLASANVMINKNYMQGFARTLNAVTDPDRYGKWWVGSNIATFIPMTTLAGGLTRALDDQILRQQNNVGDFFKARLFNMAKTLTPIRDMWGRIVHKRSGIGAIYDFTSPIAAKPIKIEPINTELARLAISPLRGDASVPRKIGKNTTFMQVKVDFSQWPQVYDQYAELAGSAPVDLTDKPLLETLNEMVQGKGPYGEMYESLEGDFQRLDMIGGLVEMQRLKAQYTVYTDPANAGFKEWIEQMQANGAKIKQGDENALETIPLPTT